MATEKKKWSDVFSSSAKERKTPEIGHFEEAPGGGTPLPKGAKAPSKAWVDANRKMQPRDTNGQFTYNSANKKPLEYGPSRGKTVPPFLAGFRVTFAKKSGRGAVINLDGKMYTLPEGIKSRADFQRAYMEYRADEDRFVGLGKGGAKLEAGSISDRAIGRGGKAGKALNVTRGYLDSYYMKVKKENEGKVVSKRAFNKKGASATPTPKAPTTPTPTPAPKAETPKETSKKGKVDYSKAKTDPDVFIEENLDEIDSIIKEADAAGYEIDADAMVEAIASGDFKDFDAIRATLR